MELQAEVGPSVLEFQGSRTAFCVRAGEQGDEWPGSEDVTLEEAVLLCIPRIYVHLCPGHRVTMRQSTCLVAALRTFRPARSTASLPVTHAVTLSAVC